MRTYRRLVHEVFIGNVEYGCIIPGLLRRFLPRDLLRLITALTPKFKRFDPIAHGGEVLSQHCTATARPRALDGIFLKSFEK